MLAPALTLILLAAPDVRPDGVWYPTKIAAAIAKGTVTDLDLAMGVAFKATEVDIGYGMEDETRSWRVTDGGALEVRSGEDWRPLQWKEGKKGTVKTDIKRAGELEELTWVAGSVQQLTQDRADRQKAALLGRVSGTWTAAGQTLVLGPKSTLDGKPIATRSAGCNWKCEGATEGQCLALGEVGESRLFFLSGKKLIEVAIEGACGIPGGAGVEPVSGGTTFDRK